MDYCDPCRRHLNGALACPGCGTSAEALRWREPEYHAVPHGSGGVTDGAGGFHGAEEGSGSHGDYSTDEDYGTDGSDEPDEPDEGDEGENREHLGRAARRRGRGRGPVTEGPGPGGASRRDRKAAAHRRRRRRTLFIAAGFVLAAGGLSLAELGMDAPKSTPKPAAAGGESADGDASVEAGEPGRSSGEAARADGASGSPSPGASDSPSASASPKDGKSKSPTEEETPGDAESATAGTSPSRPTSAPTAAPPAPAPTPTPGRTTPPPEPEPSPSETCNRFLWWCT
ncbi:SCO2400 family protein [Streptomyces olindensis]|uniref:SCO2400 family protein n=1 Tax=Streptomyces olindensis TaxID=358823 RepID=UPI003F4D6EC1